MDGATLVPRALELLRTSGDLLYTLGNLAGFVAMLAIASYVWQHRDAPQAATLAVLTAGAALWSGSVALQQVGTDYYVLRASLQVTYLGITVATAGWIAFALAFTNREELLTRRVAAALAVEPILVTLVGSTNEIAGHYLFWATMEPASDGLTTAYGIGFWFHSIYTWTVLFVGAVLLIQHFVRYRSVYRWQSVAGLVAVVAPWAGSIAFVTGNVEVDFGPLGIVVSGIAFGWAIANYELIDLAPIARRTAWGELEDAVVTLDEDDRVVDANEAAIELFDVEEPPEGKPAAEFFAAVPNEVLTELDDVDDVDTQLTVRLEDEQRYLSLSISPIGGSEHTRNGRVIVLRDITELKGRERALQARERELDVLRQVQSRILRHNLRNELTTVRGNAELLERVVEDEYEDRADDIVRASEDLLSISEKVHIVEKLIDDRPDQREYDLRTCVERVAAQVQQEHPELSVSIEGARQCPVTACPKLSVAIENLLENAAIHADSDNPDVTVQLTASPQPQLTISDDGPGIPEQEIAVLRQGEETSLEHGSGIGLWLVRWIVDRSNAELSFETGEEGTIVTIRFRTTADPDPRAFGQVS